MTPCAEEVVIRLLGGFGATVDGRDIPDGAWSGRRARELVQLLALADGHQLLRDQVIDALWPHLDVDAAAANLRKAAHHARQALGDPDAVVLQGGRVSLFPARSVAVDADRFGDDARKALAGGDAEECARLADRYGGELLPESLYEEWTQAPRAQLSARHLELLRAGGRWARVVEVEPTDEGAYQELMRQALATGARSDAIRWFGRLRGALARELGVAPDATSERLYQESIAGVTVAPPDFVGRQLELATVTSALRAATSGRAAAILLRGPAGIGKSAFCHQMTRLAGDEGFETLSVDVTDDAGPYAPLIAAIEQLVGTDRGLLDAVGPQTRSVLAALTPVAAPAGGRDGPLNRHQVIGAFRRVLVASSRPHPILVVVDDAHAADESSLDALIQLAGAGAPVVVALAYRPESAPRTLERGAARLQRADRAVVIDLGPLDRDDAATLVRSAAGSDPPTPAVVDRIVELGAGNPFATLELARTSGADDLRALPRNVSEAITARLVDLDDDTVAVLRRIALASDDLDAATVVALTGSTEEQAFAVLDRALGAGVLVVVDGRYRFRHALVRQALVDQVAPHERLAVHRDAARRLTVAGAPPAVVARHWLAGGRPDEAVGPLLQAAEQAMGLGAFAAAVSFLEPLLAHEPAHPAALRLRAEALDVMGDVGTVAAYDEAIAVADPADAEDLRAKRALAQLKTGDVPGALQFLEGVQPTSVDGRLAEALTYAGAAALGYTDPAAGTAKSAMVRRLALESGDTSAIVVASWAQAAAAHARGELRDSVLADLRETSHLPRLAVRVFDGQLCVTQRLLYGSRPYPDVIAFADALAAEAGRLGAARGHAFGVTLRGEAELLSGQLDEAERHLTEGARLHRAIGGATGEALALQRLAELALYRGDRAQASALLDEALDVARVTDIGFHLLDRIYGTCISLAPDPAEALVVVEEAEESVRGALETCPGCRITFAVPAAIASARAGDFDRVAEYEPAAEFLANVVMRLPAWNAALEEVRGHIARARGDHPEAAQRFRAAADGFGAAGHPLDQRRCVELAAAGPGGQV